MENVGVMGIVRGWPLDMTSTGWCLSVGFVPAQVSSAAGQLPNAVLPPGASRLPWTGLSELLTQPSLVHLLLSLVLFSTDSRKFPEQQGSSSLFWDKELLGPEGVWVRLKQVASFCSFRSSSNWCFQLLPSELSVIKASDS